MKKKDFVYHPYELLNRNPRRTTGALLANYSKDYPALRDRVAFSEGNFSDQAVGTEASLWDSIRETQLAAVNKESTIKVEGFVGSPDGHCAIVACFVTCPDGIAKQVASVVAAAVNEAFAKLGMH